ncbi:MAG: hypothetical protein Q8Q10_01660 [bacterium]|nr:hypothetical protein [bacterium]
MDKKVDLLSLLTVAKAWSALGVIRDKTPAERTVFVVETFKLACISHDDEYALQWFGFLLQAIQAEEDVQEKPTETDWQVKQKAKKDSEIRVILAQANSARTLYAELPRFRAGTGREWVDQDETRPVPMDFPTLLKTKRAMLNVIAKGWSGAPTDEVADEFFKFLLQVERTARFSDEKKLVGEVVREITDSTFPVARIVYTLRNYPRDYTETIGIAWVKHCYDVSCYSGSNAGLVLGAVGSFFEASPAATQLLGKLADEVLNLDHQVQALEGLRHSHEVVYLSLQEVVVRFKYKGREEKDLHRAFEQARDEIREAKKTWTSNRVRVRLEGALVWGYDDKTVFATRTEDL